MTVMIEDFRLANLIDLQLPDAQKERLWRNGIVANTPAMDVISALSRNYVENEQEARILVNDAIRINKKICHYSGSFFSYRQNSVPAEIYYAAIARPLIDEFPEWFPHLPHEYEGLRKQLEIVDDNPEKISDLKIERPAKFCHYVDSVIKLEKFRHGLRSGGISAAGGTKTNNFTSSDAIAKRYRSEVAHVKDHFEMKFGIVDDARQLTLDIDYFLNHYNNEFAWYVPLAARQKEQVLDNDFMFGHTKMKDVGRVRNVFNLTYDFYKAKHRDEPFSAYYEFCEKVLSPAQLFSTCFTELREKSVLHALTYKATQEGLALEVPPDLSQGTLNALATAFDFSELAFRAMRMRGTVYAPFLRNADVVDLYTKLQTTENTPCQGLALEDSFHGYRAIAIEVYNSLARPNGLELYQASPKAPPGP